MSGESQIPPRRHRLPQRLDWKLIPPPLDLSKPIVDDNAALPAIIVTPSSPKGSRDFQIAFLAPPEEETLCKRVFSRVSKNSGSGPSSSATFPQFRPRTLFLLFIPIFLLFCHVLVHRLGTYHPHLHFDMHTQGSIAHVSNGEREGWFDFHDYREARHERGVVIDEDPL
ncbi:hypothetical protein ACEPAH_6048 [Sanghuangporus vaninii]